MPEVRNFDEEYKLNEREPIRFVLNGFEFETKRWAHPKALTNGGGLRGMSVSVAFMRQVLIPEHVEKFNEMLEDDGAMIDAKQVDSIASWLIGEFSGRPTQASPTPVSS